MTNHEGHIKLWDKLAKTGSDDKRKIFRSIFPKKDIPACCCFACDEAYIRNLDGVEDDCYFCPLDIDDECCGGFYAEWLATKKLAERKRLAAIIRDLPWKEKGHD